MLQTERASRGLRGIVLETIQVGGTTCTSQESLQRFFERLQAVTFHTEPVRERPTKRREKTMSEAEQLLQEERF